MVGAVQFAFLPSRALVAVHGADSRDFLQGLISNDIRKVKDTHAIYAALLSPQGKFLFDFIIAPWEQGVLLDCEAARADDLIKRLSLYRLRAQVMIERMGQLGVGVVWGNSPHSPGRCRTHDGVMEIADPRLPALGSRLIGTKAAMEAYATKLHAVTMDANAYDAHRIALGVPDGSRDMIVDRSLLLEFGFEPLSGVDFVKGCYVGQEVTARSKHRAQLRKGLHTVHSDSGELPPSGSTITLDGKEVGELRSHAGSHGLAVLQFEAVQQSQSNHLPLLCENKTLHATLPEWMDKALALAGD